MRTFNEYVESQNGQVPVYFRAYFEKPVEDYKPYYELAQKIAAQLKGFPTTVPDADNKSIDFQLIIPKVFLSGEGREWWDEMKSELKDTFNKHISGMTPPLNQHKIEVVEIAIIPSDIEDPDDMPEEPDYSQDEPRRPEF